MEEKTEDKLRKVVNSSGFPLQIGLRNEIEKNTGGHGWTVLSSEHPWQDIETGNNGFIDLVLLDPYKTQVMVIECKRVRDTTWLFLNPSDSINYRRHARFWLTSVSSDNTRYFNWHDGALVPSSPESDCCVVPGQDKSRKPMLERTAAELVEATEALALEEYKLHKQDYDFLRLYFSMIVTTAELRICNFKPDNISLATGDISTAGFETVPYLRFRKSLTTKPPSNLNAKDIKEVVRAKERTIFIVNALKLSDFLSSWEVNDSSLSVLGNVI